MVDKYTKAVLTVIAAALLGIVAQNAMQPASAQAVPCGAAMAPCSVVITGSLHPLFVTNTLQSPLWVNALR